ncbi:tannase and feruloyl esterase [Daedalea quercina L-15889]|uniref:Carboxylic ester hydrolase n=1 Tax=Daedalea quercina L-15889 TaxID=1314783 RepID=A0A165M787_9APHY|nr:tannase and feruloyl esterase [Daedalea quercina L-15889]
MRFPLTALFSLAVGVQAALTAAQSLESRCTPSTFSSVIPSNATLIYAVPYAENTTFNGTVAVGPAFCAVYVNVTSSASSAFEFGLWLPLDTWNGRFIAYGNGGFIGEVAWTDMANGLSYGFAAVSTNTGHNSTENTGAWALDAPEKRTDWGWRAMHGSVSLGKELTTAFYNGSIAYSYYAGCSTGGRQGLKSAQMFPDDFDGIVAGSPAWWTTHLQQWNLKVSTYNLPNDAPYHINESLFSVIADEVFRQCDAVDGLEDGIITNPYACDFRPDTLLCNSTVANTSTCLTGPQIDTLYKIYGDWVDVNQTFVFPHLTLSSEAQWSIALVNANESDPSGIDYARYFLYDDPEWPWQDLDYATVQLADELNPGNATAWDYDMSPFYEKGGKLIHYHGLADGSIATGSSIYFWNHVQRALVPQGVPVSDFYRFFLIPGMQHCVGGVNDAPWYIAGAGQGTGFYSVPGYMDAQHDVVLAIMNWVENGTAPDTIIATKFLDDEPDEGVIVQRPLCQYPALAKYVSGDPNVTTSFECEEI